MDKLTVRDLMRNEFNLLDIDTSEIRELSNALPRDGNIDTNNAEVLATKYLRGADICGEMLAIATAHIAKAKTKKSITYNMAFVKYKDDKKIKTDKLRAAMAEIDDDYIESCNKHDEILAFVKWIDSKYNNFIRMHYLCKKILDRAYPHERASGWNSSLDDDMYDNNDTW